MNTFKITFLSLLLGFTVSSSSLAAEEGPSLPSSESRRAMVLNLASEAKRLDGDGLIPRENRPQSWENTIEQLAGEAENSQTLYDLGRVFKRLNATYPNLHANVFLIPELDERKTEGTVTFPFNFFPTKTSRESKDSPFRIKLFPHYQGDLENGDELIAINSKPLREWTNENFIFCKFPYREQCEIEFYDNFKNEILSWNRHQPLEFKVLRKNQEFTFTIKPNIQPMNQDEKPHEFPCDVSPNRYKGFQLVYEGEHLCAFESRQNPRIVTLRIKSFQYKGYPFAVLDGEVQIFWNNYWRKKSPTIKTLLLDVIDNYGGQNPTPYYALFYSNPYQEQYVQFKKIEEFERPDILESLFWGDKGKEIWFENIKKDGTFSRAKNGDFFDPIPQFCSSSKKDCREGLFEPRKNGFKGHVRLLMNHWCVSSCVGFVSNIKDLLKDRVKTYGLPDSGDSAYSRLSIFVNPASNGTARTSIEAMKKARHPDNPEAWVRQVVSVTRSTDKNGHVLSGIPQTIDVWVPRKWNQTDEEWAASVFNKAIE